VEPLSLAAAIITNFVGPRSALTTAIYLCKYAARTQHQYVLVILYMYVSAWYKINCGSIARTAGSNHVYVCVHV
jgi:hypothetical protein